MRNKLVLSFCAAALLAVSVSAQTVDELIDKNIKAHGGLDKLKAVQSMKLTGKMKMGPMEAPFTEFKKRPTNLRSEFTIQGMTGIQAYDGSTGWMIMPFMGKKDAELMTADMIKNVKDGADFDGPLIDYRIKGNKVELLGKENVQGRPAYKLHLTTNSGAESTVFLDADSYLEIRLESKGTVQGQAVESGTTISDYREVGGLMFAMSFETKSKNAGSEGAQTITFEKIELNPASIDLAMFHMPDVKK